VSAAGAELAQLRQLVKDPRLDGVRLEFNEAPRVLRIAELVLGGVIDAARSRHDAAARQLREAAELEDALNYGEPPDWTMPVRQDLGAVLLAAGKGAEAEQAFRADLKRFPRNGWSLAGLARALMAQNRSSDAAAVQAELRDAWQTADLPLPESR
jgi:hypothetical protein